MSEAWPIHRLQVTIEATRELQLSPYAGGQLYGWLSEVFRRPGAGSGIPEGVVLEVPELARLRVLRGEPYSFGVVFLGYGRAEAAALEARLVKGLHAIAHRERGERAVFDGNYRVLEVRDLVADAPLKRGTRSVPLPTEVLEEAASQWRGRRLTLHFTSPLRMRRAKSDRQKSGGHFDARAFDPALFLRRLLGRLSSLEVPFEKVDVRSSSARLIDNRLTWVDFHYGPRTRRKALGGALGQIELDLRDRSLLLPILWGQHVRVGENSRFGFGRYLVEGADGTAFPCPRSKSLLEVWLDPLRTEGRAARLAEDARLGPGQLRSRVRRVIDGTYRPRPNRRLLVAEAGREPRVLSIPLDVDRALQRLVAKELTPALDAFFEESSFAYRKGLSRKRAAARLRAATREGFRFALKADFWRFFDSIDHRLLRARLDAYLGDVRLVDTLMRWVACGAPRRGRGLPTGAPLSPVLANLFLDRFDEEIEATGARLVRYSDDFLVLFRDEREAQTVADDARRSAEALALRLNEEKTGVIDLREPFVYLGYEFIWRQTWMLRGDAVPRLVEDLGWRRARRTSSPLGGRRLPGESDELDEGFAASIVADSDVRSVQVHEGMLRFVGDRDEVLGEVTLDRVREVLFPSGAQFGRQVLSRLLDRGIPVHLWGGPREPVALVGAHAETRRADVQLAQARAAERSAASLALARTLVAAKIANYADLSRALEGGEARERTAEMLDLLPSVARAGDLDTLLGFEGTAAARWYGGLEAYLPAGFGFAGRTAPGARDPVNALLNLGFTILHRLQVVELERAGLLAAVGFLHRPRRGHAALASDLQEPLRHVVERHVLTALEDLRPEDFVGAGGGLYLKRHRRRWFSARLLRALTRRVLDGEGVLRSYRGHMTSQARSLRRHLLEEHPPFVPFRHPPWPST